MKNANKKNIIIAIIVIIVIFVGILIFAFRGSNKGNTTNNIDDTSEENELANNQISNSIIINRNEIPEPEPFEEKDPTDTTHLSSNTEE